MPSSRAAIESEENNKEKIVKSALMITLKRKSVIIPKINIIVVLIS
jgi:hypothetical protein